MKKYVIILLSVLLLSISIMTACSTNDASSYHEREVKKLQNELYYKGSDGKWYLK